MIKQFISPMLLLTLLLPASPSYSTEKITLVTGEWPPFTSEHLEDYGFFTEVVTAVFKEAGYQAEYQFYPWLRSEAIVKKGQAFATFPYAMTDERKREFDFSDPIFKAIYRLFYLKHNLIS